MAGISDLINGMTPEERQRLTMYTLGGASSAIAPYLGASRTPVSLGQILAAAGGGAMQGQALGLRQNTLDQQANLRGQLLQQQADFEQQKADQAAADRKAREDLIANAPPEMRQALQAVGAFGPGAAKLFAPPEPAKPMQVGNDVIQLQPDGTVKKLYSASFAPSAPRETWRAASPEELAQSGLPAGSPLMISSTGDRKILSAGQGATTYQNIPLEKNKELGLPAGIPFQVSSTGKIDAIVSPRSQSPFQQTSTLRTQYEKNIAPIRTVAENASKMKSGFELKTGGGDMAGIFAFMKILDPTSVVREGEYATAESAGRNVPTIVWQLYNKALEGSKLTDAQRNQMQSAGLSQLGAYRMQYDQIRKMYGDLATSYELDPAQVLTPLPGLEDTSPQATAPAGFASGPAAEPAKIDNLDWLPQ